MSDRKRRASGFAHRRGLPAPDERGRYVVKTEWVRADTAINAGLIVIGAYMVQTLLGTGVADVPAQISIIGWAAAIPMLAALAMLNLIREWYRYTSYPIYWSLAWLVAHCAALVGLVAAFWHIWLPAAIVLTISGLVAFALYRVSVGRLLRDNSPL